jgi:hypothetical protein
MARMSDAPFNVRSLLAEQIVAAAERLVEGLTFDDSGNGGLISRETIRKADELRVLLLRWRKRGRA